MKLLIVLALIATAFADEIRVVPLPNEMEIGASPLLADVSMGQLIIPKHVMDAIKVAMPVMREAAEDDGSKIRVVDAPVADSVDVFDAPEIPSPRPDVLLSAYETADSAPEAIRIADAPIFVEDAMIIEPSVPEVVEAIKIAVPEFSPVAEEFVPEPIQIAKAALPETDAVRVADAPLEGPQPVVLPAAPLPAYETAEAVPVVDAVRVAVPQFPKQYDDAMLR